jgi:hypothetical protein
MIDNTLPYLSISISLSQTISGIKDCSEHDTGRNIYNSSSFYIFDMKRGEMMHWISSYEEKRHNSRLNPKRPKEGWTSNKFDLGMPWRDLQQTFLPEVQMQVGQAISALKRSWTAYRVCRHNGESRYLAYRINRLQNSLGLEPTLFEELEGMDDEESEEIGNEELTTDEIAAKKEEEEGSGQWNINFGEERSELTESEEEEQLNKQLQEEEKADEDDWWFS